MFFVRVALSLIAALCANAAQSAWEETTVIPVRLDSYDSKKESPLSSEAQEKESEKLFYRLDIFGKQMVLELESDQTFLAPGFIFHVVGKPEGQQGFDSSGEARCFYTGTVNGKKSSAVALNVCNGLRGGFNYGGEEYFIQPANTTGESSFLSGDMHIIRRRDRRFHGEPGGSKCGVREDEERVPEHHGTESDSELLSTLDKSQGEFNIFKTLNTVRNNILISCLKLSYFELMNPVMVGTDA